MSSSNIKFITVLNKTVKAGRAVNAAVHANIGLANRLAADRPGDAAEWCDFRAFTDADGVDHPHVSGRSHIVLQGKNGDLRRLRAALLQLGVTFVDFHEGMTGGTIDEQLERCLATPEAEITYFAIAAVGPRDVLDPVTKKLSLLNRDWSA